MSLVDVAREKWCKSMYERPRTHCGVCCMLILVTSALAMGVYPLFYGEDNFSDLGAAAQITFDAIELARDLTGVDLNEYEDATTKHDNIQIFYQTHQLDEDIFNARNLQTMCQFEQRLIAKSSFGFNECDLLSESETCVSSTHPNRGQTSIVKRFYLNADPAFNFQNCSLLSESEVELFAAEFYFGIQNDTDKRQFDGLFVNSDTRASMARSILYVSNPQRSVVDKVLISMENDMFDICGMHGNFFRTEYRDKCFIDDLEMLWGCNFLIQHEVDGLLISDFLMIVGSFLFVGIWMKFYIHSNILALCCMGYIFATLSVAMFVYKLCFQMKYFNLIQTVGLFLMVGIGADGIFVVMDAWIQSAIVFANVASKEEKGLKRLIYTYQRSSSTVFCTSLTTIVAFLATSFSSIISISAFGIFFSVCLFVQYIFILTIIPSTLVWYHKHYEGLEDRYGKLAIDSEHSGKISRIIADYYVPLIINHAMKILALTSTLAILGVVGTTYIRPLSGVEQSFASDHMFQVSYALLSSFVAGADSVLDRGTFSLGIEGLHRDLFSHYSGRVEEFKDKVVFDKDFSLTGSTSIPAIVDFCDQLEVLPCDLKICNGFGILVSPETPDYQHICPVKSLLQWYETTGFASAFNNKTLFELDEEETLVAIENFIIQFPDLAEHFGIIDDDLKFITLEFRFVYAFAIAPKEGDKVKGLLNEFVDDFMTTAPDSLGTIRFTSPQMLDSATAVALSNSVKRGLMITFPVIFIILLYALNNFILAFYTMLAIGCINVCVLGFVFAILGWELGFIASIVSVMIVGLSVDYCIHLCHMYMFAFTKNGIYGRRERFAFAVTKMGSTVLAGGATTLGSGLFLFGGQLETFRKLAIMLTVTIILSVTYALFFLMPLIVLIGPQGNQGILCRPKMTETDEKRENISKSLEASTKAYATNISL